MREQFRQEMKELTDTLVLQAQAASKAITGAAASLKDANLALAERVIDADHTIDMLERDIDEMGVSLLARQAPVASDLRTVVSALRLSATLERMGDLARHVAYVARGRFPKTVASGEVQELFENMADKAAQVGQLVAKLVETQDLSLADEIIAGDDALDDMHAKTFEFALDESLELSRQEIVDVILLGRYLERFGDHGVSVAHRMRFLVTGMEPDDEARAEIEEF
ncbi:phosphate signaling complex protein PhoU [Trueperella bialowiezensis]|uniref:Phosphate-specific transport system accessory protein PhoU n=1 Tax=Trueperella bialowiezensis TaxID=312285 RepID=A0A448PE03_9ACTO|nr:phosphate signaling complex protein PhoU [Trueperella bialowiezensis]VEI13134.1 Phosphate transport system protein phoU homolog [Trueperella bialowiezensis]